MYTKGCFISTLFMLLAALTACQESMEERAARNAKDYTRKYCPTPFINYIRTDSITFDRQKLTYYYHCTFNGVLDNADFIKNNEQKIRNLLVSSVRQSTSMKPYIEAGFHFFYICRSETDSANILIKAGF